LIEVNPSLSSWSILSSIYPTKACCPSGREFTFRSHDMLRYAEYYDIFTSPSGVTSLT
jgi:hypothetical protein